MSFFEKLKKITNKLTKETGKKVENTKLDFKIRGLNRKLDSLFSESGVLAYNNSKNKDFDEPKLNSLFNEIDSVKNQITNLENSYINKNKTETKKVIDNNTQKKYTKIKVTDSDLRVKRTENGIQVLRFCPSCKAGNSPEELVCVNCGFTLKKTT